MCLSHCGVCRMSAWLLLIARGALGVWALALLLLALLLLLWVLLTLLLLVVVVFGERS